MEGTLPTSETDTNQVLENNTNPSTTPPQVNVDAEAIRKELEQERMRKNQLENELKKIREAQEEAKTKELADKEEYRTLYENERAERERLISEREQSDRQATLTREKETILAEFPEAVKEIAEETGLSLLDDSEESKELLKAKLTKIAERVGATAKVTPNNTRETSTTKTRNELIREYRETGNKDAINAAIADLSFVKPFTEQR